MLHRPALMALILSLPLFFLYVELWLHAMSSHFWEAFKRSKHAMPLHFGCRVLKCMQRRNRSSELNIMSQHDTCLDVAVYKRASPIPFEMIWYSFHLVDGWQGLEWLYFNSTTTSTQNILLKMKNIISIRKITLITITKALRFRNFFLVIPLT
jgi:hypothetical protein